MKVLVFTFLLLAVTSLEAAVVKREAPNPMFGYDEISKAFTSLTDMLTSGTQDLVQKIQAQDLGTQAQTYFEKTQQQMEPLKTEFNKILENLVKMAKGLGQ
ncbi:apolipoprotein A-II [Lissotriton helveticus]